MSNPTTKRSTPPPPPVKKGAGFGQYQRPAPKKTAPPPPKPALTLAPADPVTTGKYAALARARLKRVVLEEPERAYFSTGDRLFDGFFGVPNAGLFTGGQVELRGESSSGKSLLAADLAARCLKRGAIIHWVDVETSFSDDWMASRGLPRSAVNLYQPFLGLFDNQKSDGEEKLGKREIAKMLGDPKARAKLIESGRLESAEEIIEDVEMAIKLAHAENPEAFQLLVLDSVAALMTDEEINTELADHNMRTKMTLGMLMGQVCKRWMGFLAQHRAYALLLNQVRVNPMAGPYKDPHYSPGARAMTFYPQIRLEMHRKTGFLTQNNMPIGICGKVKCFKNKADGKEGKVLLYKLPYKGIGKLEEID